MYLMIFVLRKLRTVAVLVASWSFVYIVPKVLAMLHAFDGLAIEGRCMDVSVSKCGQDNMVLAYIVAGLIGTIPGITATWLVANWDDSDWIREREHLRQQQANQPSNVPPPNPDIYS